jgi:hypothetical protein
VAGGRVPQPHGVVQVWVAEIGDVQRFTDPAHLFMGRATPATVIRAPPSSARFAGNLLPTSIHPEQQLRNLSGIEDDAFPLRDG